MRSIYERRAQQELESEGYFVDYKIRPTFVPRGYKVDFFGLFDLIAHKEGQPLRWISIKGKMGQYGKMRQPIIDFKIPSGNVKEIWAINAVGVWKKDVID